MDLALLDRGKRGAEEAVEAEMVSAKKQKVEENVSEIEIDTVEVEKGGETSSQADSSCSQPEQLSKVKASGLDGHVGLLLEDKSNALEEDTVEAENKPEVALKEGDRAVAVAVDEPNDDADPSLQGESSLDVDMAAIEAPASLNEEDPAAPLKKKDEFSNDSEETAVLDKDFTAANLSPTAPSPTKSLDSIQKKDGSRTHEFDSVHETNNDVNVNTAKETPPDPTEKGPVVAWEKKDELFNDDEKPNRVTAETTSSVITKQEDGTNEELEELDDGTSSSDDDPQTPDTPIEQTSGGKTLFLGNLSFSVEREDVEQLFEAAEGVVNIRFAMNSNETFKGYGYVDFASAEAAEKALRELNGKELLRRRVRLEFVKDRRLFTPYTGRQGIESSEKGGKAQGTTIFVRGFDKSGGQDEIRRSLEEHFSSCGEIARVSVPKDQDGSIRGIAFIDFKDNDAFIRALALNGDKFKEGILLVKEAKPAGDGRDGVGSSRGYVRNDGRYNWQEFGGRSGLSNFRGRSGLSEFRGRSGRSDFLERNDLSDFRGRNDWSGHYGRDGQSDIHGRGGWSNIHGIQSDFHGGGGRSEFHGRGGQSNSRGRGGQSDFHDRGGWSDFHGRGDQSDLRARGGWSDFRGRSSWSDYHIRNGQSDFCSRDGRSEFHRRGDRSDFNRRGDRSGFNGRGDRSDFNRRGDQSYFHGRGRTNFQGRGGLTDIHGRGVRTDFHERDGRSDFHGRGDRSNFHGRGDQPDFQGRGDRSNFHGRGDRPDFQGRGGRTDFRPRSFHETGILFGAGIWQRPNGRDAWPNYSRSGISASFNGTSYVGGSGGIGRGQGILNKPNTSAPGADNGNNTTTFNNEGKVEDQMN